MDCKEDFFCTAKKNSLQSPNDMDIWRLILEKNVPRYCGKIFSVFSTFVLITFIKGPPLSLLFLFLSFLDTRINECAISGLQEELKKCRKHMGKHLGFVMKIKQHLLQMKPLCMTQKRGSPTEAQIDIIPTSTFHNTVICILIRTSVLKAYDNIIYTQSSSRKIDGGEGIYIRRT